MYKMMASTRSGRDGLRYELFVEDEYDARAVDSSLCGASSCVRSILGAHRRCQGHGS